MTQAEHTAFQRGLSAAATHLRAEAAERIAGLLDTSDRETSHLVIGLLRSMADDIEAMLPEAEKETKPHP